MSNEARDSFLNFILEYSWLTVFCVIYQSQTLNPPCSDIELVSDPKVEQPLHITFQAKGICSFLRGGQECLSVAQVSTWCAYPGGTSAGPVKSKCILCCCNGASNQMTLGKHFISSSIFFSFSMCTSFPSSNKVRRQRIYLLKLSASPWWGSVSLGFYHS